MHNMSKKEEIIDYVLDKLFNMSYISSQKYVQYKSDFQKECSWESDLYYLVSDLRSKCTSCDRIGTQHSTVPFLKNSPYILYDQPYYVDINSEEPLVGISELILLYNNLDSFDYLRTNTKLKTDLPCPTNKKNKPLVLPTFWENIDGSIGPIHLPGQVLNFYLEKYEIPKHTLYIDQLIKCSKFKDQEPDYITVKSYSQCSFWTDLFLQILQPSIVLSFGDKSNKYLNIFTTGQLNTLNLIYNSIPVIGNHSLSFLYKGIKNLESHTKNTEYAFEVLKSYV